MGVTMVFDLVTANLRSKRTNKFFKERISTQEIISAYSHTLVLTLVLHNTVSVKILLAFIYIFEQFFFY